MVRAAFISELYELSQPSLLDSINMDVDLDFLTEIDNIANADEFSSCLLGDEFDVDGLASMELEWPQDEEPTADLISPYAPSPDTPLESFESPAQLTMESEVEFHIDLLLESMKRSEETRQQIIRHQLFIQPDPLVDKPIASSKELLCGHGSKLTTSLEQSRSILMSYMQQLQTF
jgi:hypothetical protein